MYQTSAFHNILNFICTYLSNGLHLISQDFIPDLQERVVAKDRFVTVISIEIHWYYSRAVVGFL